MILGVTAGLIGFFAFLIMRVSQPAMGLLYSDLNITEAGAITTQLEAMNMPYELRGDGSQVYVPQDEVLRARMSLAQQGLPSGGSLGYELFDRTDNFGATSFVQNLNRTRALEGELARSIRTINGVSNARVHLVLPRRGVFENQTQEASASIILRLTRSLDREQVRAIQNLVAAAVPDLQTGRISIVDDKGELLASGSDDPTKAAAGSESIDARRNYEERLRASIEGLLERSVGIGNVRAEVNADMDFDRVTSNIEQYDPDGQVARSVQNVTETENSSQGNADNVSIANNIPQEEQTGGARNQQNSQRSEETTNFEISRTVTTQIREAGQVRRLSVAVLVNQVPVTGTDGEVTFQPRPPEQLQQLEQLVRTAMGFDETRGDELQLVSLPFTVNEQLGPPPEEGLLLGMSRAELFRIGEIGILAVLGLLAMLFVVRPIVNRIVRGAPAGGHALAAAGTAGRLTGPDVIAAQPRGDGGDLPQGADLAQLARPRSGIEEMIDIARIEGQVKASSLSKIGEIVERNPNEAVAIMRNWLYQGG